MAKMAETEVEMVQNQQFIPTYINQIADPGLVF